MRIRTAAIPLCCLLFLLQFAALAPAQNLPQECRDAMDSRSPQAQVDLFSRCLDTGLLSSEEKETALKQRAIAYMHLGQHPRALQDAEMAIKLKPSDPDGYYLRGFAYRSLGKYERAIEDSDRAIRMESNFAAAFANRAFAHKALGNINQAKSDARRALELDPKVKVPSF